MMPEIFIADRIHIIQSMMGPMKKKNKDGISTEWRKK